MYVSGDIDDTMADFARDMQNCTIVDGSISLLMVNNAVEPHKQKEQMEIMSKYVNKTSNLSANYIFILCFRVKIIS